MLLPLKVATRHLVTVEVPIATAVVLLISLFSHASAVPTSRGSLMAADRSILAAVGMALWYPVPVGRDWDCAPDWLRGS